MGWNAGVYPTVTIPDAKVAGRILACIVTHPLRLRCAFAPFLLAPGRECELHILHRRQLTAIVESALRQDVPKAIAESASSGHIGQITIEMHADIGVAAA